MEITIFGKGNMGSAIGKNFEEAGNNVKYYDSETHPDHLGEIVILAVPYPALKKIAQTYHDQLRDKNCC